MCMQVVCTSNKMWAEVSNEFGPSCLINFGPDLDRNYLALLWYGNVRFTFNLLFAIKNVQNMEPEQNCMCSIVCAFSKQQLNA